MSSPAAQAVPALPADAASSHDLAGKALKVGFGGLIITAAGLLLPGNARAVAMSYLVGVTYWTAIAIGMLMLVLIHHIFDASWSTVIRRQFEHGLAAFKWLALLFLPLVLASFLYQRDIVWPWLNLEHEMHGGHTVGHDPLYLKKAAFLNPAMFLGMTALFFVIWVWLSARLRKASFSQDSDGDLRWTRMNRTTAAMGLPLGALTLTFAAIYWVKSLEYHWFSTMCRLVLRQLRAWCLGLRCHHHGVALASWRLQGHPEHEPLPQHRHADAGLYRLLGLRHVLPIFPDLERQRSRGNVLVQSS